MIPGKFIIRLSEEGVANLAKVDLSIFIFQSRFLLVDEFDLGYSFASLKAIAIKYPEKRYELWIPSSYVEFVLEKKLAEPLLPGFQNTETDSSPGNS